MRMNDERCERRVRMGEEEVEDVHKFVHVGAVTRNTGGTTEDINSRLSEARMTQRALV